MKINQSAFDLLNNIQDMYEYDAYIRIAVQGNGCTGFEYVNTVALTIRPDDVVFSEKFIADPFSALYLNNAELDVNPNIGQWGDFKIINSEFKCNCASI